MRGAMFAVLVVVCAGAGAQARDAIAPTLSERAYNRLAQAQTALAANDAATARRVLEDMAQQLQLSAYEQALVDQTWGFLLQSVGDIDAAITRFEASVATDALPLAPRQDLLFTLAGLYATRAQWQRTVATLERWLATKPRLSAHAAALIATAYAEVSRHAEAVPWLEQALAELPQPDQDLAQLRFQLFWELDNFQAAIVAAQALVQQWPARAQFWRMLLAAYGAAGDDAGALATAQLAYAQGVLADAASIVELARWQLLVGVPFDAGELLSRELRSGRLPATADNLRLLLASWEAANEFERALGVLDTLADLTGDSSLYVRKAQLLAQRQRWQEAIDATSAALAEPALAADVRGAALLQQGVALLELNNYTEAQAAFAQAAKLDHQAAKQARAWLVYLRQLR